MNELITSIENVDITQPKIRITSPHSILACKYLGIDVNDLGFLTLEEYLHKNPELQNLDKEQQEERYKHYNRRRIKFIEDLQQKRKKLIKEENQNNNNENKKTNYGLFIIKNSRNNSYNNLNKTFHTIKNRDNALGKSKSMLDFNFFPPDINGDNKLKKIRKRQKINIRLKIDYQLMQERIRQKNMQKIKLKNENEKIIKMKKMNE